MSTMTIRVTNAKFESTAEGEFDTVDDAFHAGIKSGLEVAASEVAAGLQSTIVQVAVDQGDWKDVARGAVAVVTERFLATSA